MVKIVTATNNPKLNEDLKKEEEVDVLFKDIFYKEGILEILEKNINIDYLIIDEKLPGEIELNSLIEKILKVNKKIKIIITIKKENKNKININNKKIIKIFYEGKINLEKIKKYYDENYKKHKENQKVKNVNSKIINIIGERQIGKSIISISLAFYLSSKNCKILLMDLNEDNPNILTIIGLKKSNQKQRKVLKTLRRKIKKISGKFLVKYVNEKILEKMIFKINENINFLPYNKLLNFNFINKIKNNYNYLIIENYSSKNKKINRKIIKNSEENILIIRPNLLGIRGGRKIVEKNKKYLKNNLKIILNYFDINSIDEKIIENIFNNSKIISKIKYENSFDKFINENFKNCNCRNVENIIYGIKRNIN